MVDTYIIWCKHLHMYQFPTQIHLVKAASLFDKNKNIGDGQNG